MNLYFEVRICVCLSETVCVPVFVVRSVLLFRPPRLKNMFEDSMVVFTDYLTIGSLRRFIRDHM